MREPESNRSDLRGLGKRRERGTCRTRARLLRRRFALGGTESQPSPQGACAKRHQASAGGWTRVFSLKGENALKASSGRVFAETSEGKVMSAQRCPWSELPSPRSSSKRTL